MLQFKQILKFSLWMLLLSGLLLWPWKFVERGYAHTFQAVNSRLFSQFWFWSAGKAAFIDMRQPGKDMIAAIDEATPGDLRNSNFRPMAPTAQLDTLVVVMNREKPGPFGQFRIASRELGYWPAAWLLALILAKSLPLKRKAWALLFGMILVHAFVAFRISVKLLHGGMAVTGKKYTLFEPSPSWASFLDRLNQMFVEDPTMSYVIPTLIWFIVAFTRHDWAAVRQLAVREPDDDEAQP